MSIRFTGMVPLCALLSLIASAALAQPQEPMTLALNDALGTPGGVAALVFRTYASRPVGQGQVCVGFRAQRAGGGGPIDQILGGRVYALAGDTAYDMALSNSGGQEIMLTFDSPSASINALDGPLAVIYVRLDEDASPGERYDVEPLLADSFLLDAEGEPIPLEVRGARLRVELPSEPMELAAAAEATVPGETAFLSVQTRRVQPLSGGQVGFRFDPAIADGLPTVRIDRRYGAATFNLSGSLPEQGLLLITFDSPTGDLNRLPGDIISVRLPTRADIALGTSSAISLDPALTFIHAPNGQLLPIEHDPDVIVFE